MATKKAVKKVAAKKAVTKRSPKKHIEILERKTGLDGFPKTLEGKFPNKRAVPTKFTTFVDIELIKTPKMSQEVLNPTKPAKSHPHKWVRGIVRRNGNEFVKTCTVLGCGVFEYIDKNEYDSIR